MKTYAEKLKDPRWQRKRLEILERDSFTCRHCKSTEKTLHVHHRIYQKGKSPWDYDDSIFVTLCDECHEKAEERREAVQLAMGVCEPTDVSIRAISMTLSDDNTGSEESNMLRAEVKVWQGAVEGLADCIKHHYGMMIGDSDSVSTLPAIRAAIFRTAEAMFSAIDAIEEAQEP